MYENTGRTPALTPSLPQCSEGGEEKKGLPPRPLPEGVQEGLHAVLENAVASAKESQLAHGAGDVSHIAPPFPPQGQQTQGHVNHSQQVNIQNLHKVLFDQPLIGCHHCANAGIIHQTPESWEE